MSQTIHRQRKPESGLDEVEAKMHAKDRRAARNRVDVEVIFEDDDFIESPYYADVEYFLKYK